MSSATAAEHARLFIEARNSHQGVDWRRFTPLDADTAYAIQDATLAQIGPIGGWKVGSKGAGTQASCAPLPAAGIYASGSVLSGPQWSRRAIEAELAFRLGKDFDPGDRLPSREELLDAFDAMLPLIEVVETRLAATPCEEPLVSLADLLSHGALVLGKAVPLPAEAPDVRKLTATLYFDDRQVEHMTGTNPAGDIWPMLAWLARHCSLRGTPLKKGQIVTTGTCTGVQNAVAGQKVKAVLEGVGEVSFSF
jgi:2-keto-4-pentenoate hydratase